MEGKVFDTYGKGKQNNMNVFLFIVIATLLWLFRFKSIWPILKNVEPLKETQTCMHASSESVVWRQLFSPSQRTSSQWKVCYTKLGLYHNITSRLHTWQNVYSGSLLFEILVYRVSHDLQQKCLECLCVTCRHLLSQLWCASVWCVVHASHIRSLRYQLDIHV